MLAMKSLSDLTFPPPPENVAQAFGFTNQVLMAIEKVQRIVGDEVDANGLRTVCLFPRPASRQINDSRAGILTLDLFVCHVFRYLLSQ